VSLIEVLNPRRLSSRATNSIGPPEPDPRSTISFVELQLMSFERRSTQASGNGVIRYVAAKYDAIAVLKGVGNQA
jgi:hypothetical protein